MQLGMVGLGKMGANMTRRLVRGGHQLVVSDLSADAVKQLVGEGATGSTSLDDLVSKLKAPRAAWIMVPARRSHRKNRSISSQADAIWRHHHRWRQLATSKMMCAAPPMLQDKGIHYVDVGTSGGVWGLDRGYCMMIGGPKKRSSGSIRSSRRWLPDAAIFRARPGARN